MVFPVGPAVNAIAIIVGSLIGVLLGSRLPENMRKTVFHAIGLAVLVIGLQMALKSENVIILIFSLILGAIAGEFCKIEDSINKFGDFLKSKANSKNPRFTEGFLTSTILFCAGALAILASFEEGIQRDLNLAFVKSALDGVSSIALASAYGVGVLFSGFAVLIYQGIFVLFAGLLQPYISDVLLLEGSAVGGALIVAIALNILEVAKIKVANLMPAFVVVVVLVQLFL